jgi:hypothetical protein
MTTGNSIYPAEIQPDPPIAPIQAKKKVVFLTGTKKFLATLVPTVAAQEGQLNFTAFGLLNIN